MSEYSIDSEFKKLLNKKLSERALQMLSVYEEAAAKGETEKKKLRKKKPLKLKRSKVKKKRTRLISKRKKQRSRRMQTMLHLIQSSRKNSFLIPLTTRAK